MPKALKVHQYFKHGFRISDEYAEDLKIIGQGFQEWMNKYHSETRKLVKKIDREIMGG